MADEAITDDLLPSQALQELLKQKLAEQTGNVPSFFRWAMKVPEPKSGPLDFDRFPFQRELYDQEGAMDPEVVVMKSTQVGISTYLLRWAMYHADTRSQNALYVFPKRQQMYDFADARIRAAILASPYLRNRIPQSHVNNKGLKQIGAGYLYARGSESKDDLDAVDADVLCLDEYDTLRQENIPDAERRISGSRNGLIRRVGVPSIPGYGVDALYHKTDMRRWMVKCEGCNEAQALEYDQNVDEESATLVCHKCRKPLNAAKGEWVAEFPDRDVRGYHIPRLVVPNLDLRPIIEAHHKANPYEVTVHHNKDLALAYAPEEGRLSDEALAAASRADIPREAPGIPQCDLVTMGVDVASVRALNVRVSAYRLPVNGLPVKRSLFIGEAQDFGQVAELMERYQVNMCCVDHEPEHRMARALAEQFPGRVYLAHFITSRSSTVFNPDPEMRTAGVKRTEILDATFDAIRQQRNLLPMDKPPGYVKQMQALSRVVTESSDGRVRGEYRSVAADDYAFAEAYDTLALQVWLWQSSVTDTLREETMAFEDVYDWEPSQLDVVNLTADPSALDEYDPGFSGDPLDSYGIG
jgi:hypothetical protein